MLKTCLRDASGIFQFILCSPESLRSLSIALYFGIIPPFGRITNGQFDKINEPRRHSVFALIMPYMRYGIVVKNNEMKINFLLPFFYSSRPTLSLGVP